MTNRTTKPKVSRWLQLSAHLDHSQSAFIQLTQGQWAKVDAADYEWLSQWVWTAFRRTSGGWYAYRKPGRQSLMMHRAIMQPPEGMEVDHINGDGLDNRRANLRVCTHQQNSFNAPSKKGRPYKGVHFCNTSQRWIAKCKVGGKLHYFGQFKTLEEAVAAAKAGFARLHGEFAWQGE